MTTYPNPGERPERIGGGGDDIGHLTTTEELTPDRGVPRSSTEDISGGYEEVTDSTIAGSSAESSAGSKSEVAKSEASDVKDTALSAGSNVASTAKQEAGNVAQEVGAQARGLLDQLRSDVREQGSGQKDRIASTLQSLSKELGAMASKSEENGPVTDLAHQASRKGGEIAHWLENHEPSDVLDEVKRYARRRPFAFLAICAAAGIVVGRLTRGAVAANTSLDSADSGSSNRAQLSGADFRTEAYPTAAPGPYAASLGTAASSSGPDAPSTDPYAPGAGAAAQNWPPEQGYGQPPVDYTVPQTGSGESFPRPEEPARGQGEYRP